MERADLGATTATAAFFRKLGGAVGVALSGAILTARLPILMPGGIRVLTVGGQMPIAEHAAVVDAYRHALSTTFLAGAIIAAIACPRLRRFFAILARPIYLNSAPKNLQFPAGPDKSGR